MSRLDDPDYVVWVEAARNLGWTFVNKDRPVSAEEAGAWSDMIHEEPHTVVHASHGRFLPHDACSLAVLFTFAATNYAFLGMWKRGSTVTVDYPYGEDVPKTDGYRWVHEDEPLAESIRRTCTASFDFEAALGEHRFRILWRKGLTTAPEFVAAIEESCVIAADVGDIMKLPLKLKHLRKELGPYR